MNKITLSVGEDFGTVKKTTTTWEKLVAGLTTHKQADTKGGRYFVGGYFQGTRRKEGELVAMTLLTIDIDKNPNNIDVIGEALHTHLNNAFCAYTTFSHGKDDLSSLRVVIPLSREVTADEYRLLSRNYVDEEMPIDVDECSFKPNQAMFMPTCPDPWDAWATQEEGSFLDVDKYLAMGAKTVNEINETGNDLEDMLAEQPLDLTDDEVASYLTAFQAEGLDYDQWLMVGAALNHQYQGTQKGFKAWFNWSAKSSKHDDAMMRTKWKSFGNSTRVVTFASVIFHVNEQGGIGGNPDTLEALLVDADNVDNLEEYNDFVSRISTMGQSMLREDHREMIAGRLAKSFGKDTGVGKVAIKKSLQPVKKTQETDKDAPEWLQPWVFVESTCEFYNKELNYSIKREAFNAKYDREMDCIMAEKSAANFALVDCSIPTVVDTMFFPGASEVFQMEGKDMLNSYYPQGVAPCQELDEDGQAAVNQFLGHVDFTIEHPAEREILLDWMCYVVQNPGKRVHWALLLQGAQGTGKTYFVNVLQAVLGAHVKNLDPTSIGGRFTSWGHGALVNAIEEIRIAGANKYEILDRMKPFITNDTIMIEEKGRDHRTVPNFTSYLMLTNHQDAMPLIGGDRRYCVLFSRVQSEEHLFEELGGPKGAADYFDTLFGALRERPDALAMFLRGRKLSAGFNPTGRAPDTSARQAMTELAISPERAMVEDAISKHECAIINKDILDVTWLNAMCQLEEDDLPNSRALSAILLDMGYQQIPKRYVKIQKDRKNHYVWCGLRSDANIARQTVRDFHDDADFVPF